MAPKLKKNADGDAPCIDLAGDLGEFDPAGIYPLNDPQTDILRIAKDKKLTKLNKEAVRKVPTTLSLNLGDARTMHRLASARASPCALPVKARKSYFKVFQAFKMASYAKGYEIPLRCEVRDKAGR